MGARMGSELVGLLSVDKREGPTSHDVVNLVRKITRVRRVGHTGTLDPFASGLLLICIGWATRLAEYLSSLPKSYSGLMRLGERTDTDDRTGEVIARSEAWRELDAEAIRRAFELQIGTVPQHPPAFSAKKVSGRRAHRLARDGGTPKLEPQRVTIYRLELTELKLPDVRFEIECSSGTYVRAIARDVGEAIGVGGHLTRLRRVRVGGFELKGALQLGPESSAADIATAIRPPQEAVAHLPGVDLLAEESGPLSHGQPVEWADDPGSGPVAVRVAGRLAAIAQWKDRRLWPKKVLPSR